VVNGDCVDEKLQSSKGNSVHCGGVNAMHYDSHNDAQCHVYLYEQII